MEGNDKRKEKQERRRGGEIKERERGREEGREKDEKMH